MPISESGIYYNEEIKFVNTREFTRAAQHFMKYGVYTKAHPKYDKRDWDQFWDEEEKRCRFGYSVGGVRITGRHYKFLNYTQIKLTSDPEDTEGIIKDNRKLTRDKIVSFPDFWDGHYHLAHAKDEARAAGFNFIGAKGRRKGFSYWGGSDADYNYQFLPNTTTILGAFDKKYLTKGDGIMTMFKNNVHFINRIVNGVPITPWGKRRISNAADLYKSGYIKEGTEYGYKSIVWALSFKDNADAAVGKDAFTVTLDEAQTFPNLSEVLDMTIPALEDGGYKTGFLEVWGTGGSKEANWEAFEYNFYNPKDNGFLAFDNIWDPGARGTSCGFFFSHLTNYKPFIDENGNSDLINAELHFDKIAAEKEKNTTPGKYVKWIAQRPKYPRQAFTMGETNMFVSNELEQHITRVRQDPEIKHLYRTGDILFDDDIKQLRLFTNPELEKLGLTTYEPILNYPLKPNQDPHGSFVEFFPRYVDPITNQIPKGMYRIWVDPFAFNKTAEHIQTHDSLGAIYVYERANLYSRSKGDLLVACFVGRPGLDEFNAMIFKIAKYYGNHDGSIMFENDRGNVHDVAKKLNLVHLLADEPTVDWNKELKVTATGREKGISIGSNVNRKGSAAVYFHKWLYTVRGVDKYGNEKKTFHYIYDLGLLSEIAKWNLKSNFDRMSTMFVGMFDMQEQLYTDITPPKPPNPKGFFKRNLFSR